MPSERHPDLSTGEHNVIAMGGLGKVIIASFIPPYSAEVLQSITRPEYVDEHALPNLAWGYGLTPKYRERTYPVLALAWGKVIQLAVLVGLG